MKTSLRTGRIRGGLNPVAAIMPEASRSGKRAAAREACRCFALQAFSAKRNGTRLNAASSLRGAKRRSNQLAGQETYAMPLTSMIFPSSPNNQSS